MAHTPPGTGPVDKYHAPQWLGDRAVRRFHVMAKPVGSACPLSCTYCYYLSKTKLPGGPGAGHMSDETLERFIQSYIQGVTGDEIVFSWQGGEPTLLGISFFEKVVALQRRHARPGQRVENDLQTSGVLLDEDWAKFLKANRFLVGLSIDGPRELHDRIRVTKRGEPTFDKVYAAAQTLRRAGVPFNTLTCVHRYNADSPRAIYRFLRRELGSTYMQFIPIVEPKGFEGTAPGHFDRSALPRTGTPRAKPDHPLSVVTPWSVDPDQYGEFLCGIWDEWLRKDLGKVLVNFCETLVVQHMGQASQVCVFSPLCGKGLAIEHDGSVYACDHYVYPEYRLGNIADQRLGDMAFEPGQVRFGYDKSEALSRQCRKCDFLKDCWGECPKNRVVLSVDGEPGHNYLCSGLQRFFRHASAAADRIARNLQCAAPIPRMQ